MRKFKKILILAFVLISFSFSAFAYDVDSSLFLYFNNVPRDVFEEAVGSKIFEEQSVFQLIGFSSSFSSFERVDMNNMQEAEKSVFDFVNEKISSKANENDIYVSIVIEEMDILGGTFNGWGAISHKSSDSDVMSRLYHFSADF